MGKTHSGSRIKGSKRQRIPDPDPQHCKVLSLSETDPQVLYPEQRLGRVVLAASSPGHWSTWVVQSMHCPYGNEARYAFLNKTLHQTYHIYQYFGSGSEFNQVSGSVSGSGIRIYEGKNKNRKNMRNIMF
jgi:hypothetical protein